MAPVKIGTYIQFVLPHLKLYFPLNRQVIIFTMRQVSIYSSSSQFTLVSLGGVQSAMVSITMIWNLSFVFELT